MHAMGAGCRQGVVIKREIKNYRYRQWLRVSMLRLMLVAPLVLTLHSLYLSVVQINHRKLNETASNSLSAAATAVTLLPESATTSAWWAKIQEGFLRRLEVREKEENNFKQHSKFDFRPNNVTRFAIFYNIFVANDDAGVQRAKRIIAEHLDQVGSSSVNFRGTVTLFYNTIGRSLEDGYIASLCKRNHLDCRHMQHYSKGYEDLTLQRIHEFCDLHDSYRVIYMHSKGTYHDWEYEDFSQNTWRWHMTSAVLHDRCLDPPHDTCDICGLLALPWPNLHFAGNFFTAKCSYVKKLIPPKEFVLIMNDVAGRALYKKVEGKFVANLLPDGPHHYGVGRFASEHWLGSHPSVFACDLSEQPDIRVWQTPNKSQAPSFKYAIFPRHNVFARWAYMHRTAGYIETFSNPAVRLKEYFLLAGNVFRWYELYNQTPSGRSWVWSWFPDGEVWQEAVRKYGPKAVDLLTTDETVAQATIAQMEQSVLLA